MEVAKRKPNWSEIELFALFVTVNANINEIRGHFGPSLTSHDKTRIWPQVAESVNAVNASSVIRSVADCQKKWQDVKSVTKVLESLTRTQVEGIQG
ncbi:uncharacterized protein LOC134710592 [Mytilus trossulus]|uniref:uncharacterized protein LOC134710592 n=1 Tax=Mytilus trossulus TaxID=6551 RepID=UPI003006D2C1